MAVEKAPERITLRPCANEAELTDPAVTGQFAREMAAIAGETHVPPWCGYVAWRGARPVGFGGFKGPPGDKGEVEIGYMTFPGHEGGGVATEIAARMVAIAREAGVPRVIAHTLTQENASTGVLRANGFSRDGEAHDPDEGTVWRWALDL